jgi:hypothetical protein
MDIETWKGIKNFTNYEVSDYGRVRNKDGDKIKKANVSTDGFHTVSLYNKGKMKISNVHSLVASAFIDNINQYKYVRHIDGDKLNNNLSNLEWTEFINIYNIICSDNIDQIDAISNEIIKTWLNYKEICIEFDITWNDLNGSIKKQSQLSGYLWKLHPIDNTIENEEWKGMVGNPKYEISDKGRVRNTLTKKLLKLTTQEHGYVTVSINKKQFYLHRLVAFAFIDNLDPINKIFVNHLDGNKENNTVENLEWVTHPENMKHARKNNLMPTKISGVQINQLDADRNLIKTWISIKGVIDHFKVTPDSLKSAIKKGSELAGFKWEKLQKEEIDNEIWKPVKNNEDYQVSNFGRIKKGGNFINGTQSTYKRVKINNKSHQLHILIAEAFIDNPNNLPIVNHLDGNKYNNQVDNLEWTTYRENNIHAIKTGLNKSTRSQKISCYKDDKLVKSYKSIRQAERYLGASRGCIEKALKGKIHTSQGMVWKYD